MLKIRHYGGVDFTKINKRFLPLFIYISLITILLLTLKTNFNFTGYNYYLDEETMMLTIEEGFVKKETYNVQDSPIQAIKVMLPINKAHDMWGLTIFLSSLFITGIFLLFFKPSIPRKNLKLYGTVYFIFLSIFIIWDIYVHKEIIKEISNALNSL
ncbi:hypothetical protein MPH47_15690 [Psychrobacillus psychrodurans]|uniref:hypothetical protein n=1 Tax=Psychrobacillus TaxID=1221880 RepID=UPI001F4E79E1|nr:hypothetical protein [Psychrobacillus psychrodurans]MCK1998647.1 hypothetical protein [Psychrobacillus psychrodurans]